MNERAQILLLVLLLLVGVAAVTNREPIQEAIRKVVSRGIRNNNPGNIRISNIDWNGKVPVQQNTDGDFEQFVAPFFGIRAIGRDLITGSKRGDDTVREIVTAWAPPTNDSGDFENNTDAYILSVSKRTGLDPDAVINVRSELFGLVDAIMVHENGGHPYPDQLIREALAQA